MKQTTVLTLSPQADRPRYSEGSFAELSDGRILFVYCRYSGNSWADDATSDLVARYSWDQGRTWSEDERVIVPHGEALNVMSVSLLRLQDGRLALLYLRKSSSGSQGVICMPYLIFSQDDGETWSPEGASLVPFQGYHVVNNDRLIQLSSGRLVVPVAYHRPLSSVSHDSRSVVLMYLSDDGGQTFREGADWILPPQHTRNGLQEPGVIDLGDHHLLAYFRTDLGCQYGAFSTDGGDHWSVAVPTEFASPLSPLSMKRDPVTGYLYAVWNDRSAVRWGQELPCPAESSWGRTPLVLACSKDHGATWQDHRMLARDPRRGYCYTAMHFTRDRHLLLGFCCGGVENKVLQELCVVRLSLED